MNLKLNFWSLIIDLLLYGDASRSAGAQVYDDKRDW